jgi:hypothetical protein
VEAVTGDVVYTATFTATPVAPVIRDITSGKLTEAEKNTIAGLTLELWEKNCASRAVQNFFPWVYKEANINVKVEGHAAVSASNINKALSDSSKAGHAYYNAILVENSYGENMTGIGVTDLQIGDIFCGWYTYSGTAMYYAAVYQGNDNFLAVYDVPSVDAAGKVTRVAGSSIMKSADFDEINWRVRWVMRPDQLAN